MRKIITSAVLILLFSMFSGTAFAGKVQVCEDIKNNPAYKGLYGLCNAYWNADDTEKPEILDNWDKKAGPGGPSMPGLLPATCPCWPDGIASVCDLGVQMPNLAGGTVRFVNNDTLVSTVFGTNGASCANFKQDYWSSVMWDVVFFSLDGPDESSACVEELQIMAADGYCPE
jgi:hypothetical protein